MIGTVVALLLIFAAGILVTRAAGLTEASGWSAGVSFLNGVSFAGLLLFTLSVAGIGWSRATVLGSAALILAVVVALRRDRFRGFEYPAVKLSAASVVIDVLILLTLVGYALYATLSPIPEYDFIGGWGLKARVFWHAHGINWAFLTNPENMGARVDYPIQIPLVFDFVAVVRGSWEDRWIGLLFVGIAASVIVIIRGELLREFRSSFWPRAATLAMMPAALSPWVGIGEGPLIAYGCAAALVLRRAVREDDRTLFFLGALLLGGCGLTKNEGLAMVFAIACGVAVAAGSLRPLLRLWPAVPMIATWIVAKRVVGLHSELISGSVSERFVQHVGEWRVFLQAVSENPLGHRLFWAGLIVAILVTLRRTVRDEKLLLTTIALQWLAYLFVYLTTPYPLRWHIDTSWERVLTQLLLLLAFLAFSQLLHLLDARDAAPPAA